MSKTTPFQTAKRLALLPFTSSEYDNSPKGSIDTPIREICHLVNSHENYYTTSTCSGRISIFCKNAAVAAAAAALDGDDEDGEGEPDATFGKGTTGRWLLSEHRPVSIAEVRDALLLSFSSTDSSPIAITADSITFKHEPSLFHIACSTLPSAELLLKSALSAGFRESGIVLTTKKTKRFTTDPEMQIIVAIRGVGLMLSVPLWPDLIPISTEYIGRLVSAANTRFRSSEERIHRLITSLSKALHPPQPKFLPANVNISDERSVNAVWSSLPSINLRGCTCSLIQVEGGQDLVVFGGYGEGPTLPNTIKANSVGRSSSIYVLSSRSGQFASSWQIVTPLSLSFSFSPPPLEQHSACIIPLTNAYDDLRQTSNTFLCIYGGRSSPKNPSSHLYIYDHLTTSWSAPALEDASTLPVIPSTDNYTYDKPKAKWGHTMTPLSGRGGCLAVLIGGRDESSAHSSVHILCSRDGGVTFYWRSFLDSGDGVPVFQHSAALQPSAGGVFENVIVSGGIRDPFDLFKLSSSLSSSSSEAKILQVNSTSTSIKWVSSSDTLQSQPLSSSSFGSVALSNGQNCNDGGGITSNRRKIVFAGGVNAATGMNDEPVIEVYEAMSTNQILKRRVVNTFTSTIDASKMINQSGVLIPCDGSNDVELCLIGGGSGAFAFRPSYAPCYRVTLQTAGSASGDISSSSSSSSLPIVTSNSNMNTTNHPIIQEPPVTALTVHPKNVKIVKVALEKLNLIHQIYRIALSTSTDTAHSGKMAIPVIAPEFLQFWENEQRPDWASFVESVGEQVLPLKKVIMNHTSESLDLTVLQRVVDGFVSDKSERKIIFDDIILCPKSLERLGDDVIVVPAKAFIDESTGAFFLQGGQGGQKFESTFWSKIATAHRAKRIVRRGEIDPLSPIRHSGHRMLYPSNYPPTGIPNETGPGAPSWVTVIEHGVKQSFDMCRVMFSRGNVTEKKRFALLVKSGEVVLDLYAGIGYYSLPALIHGKASHVHACEWNKEAVLALRHNLKANSVSDRATVYPGDCRIGASKLTNMIDRVSLGLLPSSEGSWAVAVQSLRRSSGGWLHVHGNVAKHQKRMWGLWTCSEMLKIAHGIEGCEAWVGYVKHIERVKSFAPKVEHLVADVFVGPKALLVVLEGITEIEDGQIMMEDESDSDDLERRIVGVEEIKGGVGVPSCALIEGLFSGVGLEWMGPKIARMDVGGKSTLKEKMKTEIL